MKSHFNYSPFDNYILRTPVIPLSDVADLTVEKIKEFCNDEFIAEAIYVSSPELYREMRKQLRSDKIKDSMLYTLLKYLTRMGSRATPFGLFSGICLGHIGENTKIELAQKNEYKSCTRLDMNYLCALAYRLENINNIKNELLYFPNTSIYQIGSEIRYVEYKYNKRGERKHYLYSIESNQYIKKALKKASKGSKIKDIANVLTNNEVSFSDATQFINELIENQILISSISPPVTGEDYLGFISKNINNDLIINWIKEIKSTLHKIDDKRKYSQNRMKLYDKIQNLTSRLDIIKNEKFIVQSDLYIKTKQNNVSKKIMKDIIKGIRVLNKLMPYEKNKDIEDFKERFYRRYEDEAIPLAIALDVEVGVGYGRNKKNFNNTSDLTNDLFIVNNSDRKNEIELSKTDKFLQKKVIECLINKKKEIELTDIDLIDFTENWNDLANTFSVKTKIFENNSNTSSIYISNFGRVTAASIFGRFCHIDKKINDFALEITEKDKENNKITAEIAHLPESRTGNIIYRPHLRKYEIPYLAKSNLNIDKQIFINDLYVLVRDNKIVLYSKKLKKEVIPYLTNAHNYWSNSLPIYNFLSDIRSQNIREDLSFFWSAVFQDYEYLPRVKYKNIILSLAQWLVRKEEMNKIRTQKEVLTLMQKRNIPSLVLLIEGDNELLINFKNEISCNMFITQTKNKEKILLKEFLYSFNRSLVRQDLKPFTNEIIFSFYKNEQD